MDDKGKLVTDVHAGHQHNFASGRREMLALEDGHLNTNGKDRTKRRKAIEIDGVAVETHSAIKWENEGKLPRGTVENALSQPGWTRDLKINKRGVEVAEATGRLSKDQVSQLRNIVKGEEEFKRGTVKNNKLYRDYYQALMDSRPSRQ